ncbi:hypothetical protein HT031_003016 [Scenedesmus sp. PABB004]|nr:hypothetical protein HT031_003016 [Scenedesmus sp. PABB004]
MLDVQALCRRAAAAGPGARPPARGATPLVLALELLRALGGVVSCLLSLNGDDPAFSVARVAQAISTTTCALRAVEAAAPGAGVTDEVADALALQRCEATPLLSAVAWALRQEARALLFNPRPTALSLATALLELVEVLTRMCPADVFALPRGSARGSGGGSGASPGGAAPGTSPGARAAAARGRADPAAVRLADPAAALALAMLRCAGTAAAQVGAGQARQIMLAGLRVAWQLQGELLDLSRRAVAPAAAEPLVRQLLRSPSVLQLMVSLLALQAQRLAAQLGLGDDDDSCSFTLAHPVEAPPLSSSSSEEEDEDGDEGRASSAAHDGARPAAAPGGAAPAPGQHHDDDSDDGEDGGGALHQMWNLALGMARRQAAAAPPPDAPAPPPATPLRQLWAVLGLHDSMLELAAGAEPPPAAPTSASGPERSLADFLGACAVVRFLLQGSSHLQPARETPAARVAAAAAAAGPPSRAPPPPTGDALGSLGSGELPQGLAPLGSGELSPSSALTPISPDALTHPPPAGADGAGSPTAAAAEHLVHGLCDFGAKGAEELEALRLQRLLPLALLDVAAGLAPRLAAFVAWQGQQQQVLQEQQVLQQQQQEQQEQQQQQQQQQEGPACGPDLARPAALALIDAAAAAAAASARSWPVLQRVAAVQGSRRGSLDGGAPPAGVFFAGLTSVRWQEEHAPPDDAHLPVQEVLQLLCHLTHELLAPQQRTAPAAAAAAAAAAERDAAGGDGGEGQQQQQVMGPVTRSALIHLLEVLTAASKLPWEAGAQPHSDSDDDHHAAHHRHHHHKPAGACERDMRHVAAAWRAMCRPVAAAVEACLRAAGASSAAAAAATAAAAAAAPPPPRSQLTALLGGASPFAPAAAALPPGVGAAPSARGTVVLGSCLAALCAPLGRAGPLVAAAADAPVGGAAQLELFALLLSEIKLLLADASRRELIAMHPIEQSPVFVMERLCQARGLLPPGGGAGAPAAALADTETAAAAVPWLLLLARLLMLRGRLLGELLQRDAARAPGRRGSGSGSGDGGGTSVLHAAFWHLAMAVASASMLEANLAQFACFVRADEAGGDVVVVAGFDLAAAAAQVAGELLPALRHAVQLVKACMRLARHAGDGGLWAAGFQAGFAAGYAAAQAAAAGAPAGTVSCADPWGVLQQPSVRGLPARLQAFGAALSSQLVMSHGCCAHPGCTNLARASEAALVAGEGAVVCASCGVVRYCSGSCLDAHRARHAKHACRRLQAHAAAG